MPVTGPLDHVDICVSDVSQSLPFYAAFFGALGYERWYGQRSEFHSDPPQRAAWSLRYAGGALFGVELLPAQPDRRGRRYDGLAPGPHHLAFHAESRAAVLAVHSAMLAVGADVLDPPRDYSDRVDYGVGYYAAFYADPDGLKLEVVHLPATNP